MHAHMHDYMLQYGIHTIPYGKPSIPHNNSLSMPRYDDITHT